MVTCFRKKVLRVQCSTCALPTSEHSRKRILMLHNRYQIRGAKTNRPTSKLHYWRRGGVPGNTGAEH